MRSFKKRGISIVLTVLALILAGMPLPLLAGVSNTKHNLAFWSGNTFRSQNTSQVCKFCHTPHNANPAVPLWGHELSGETFQKYSSATLVIDAATSQSKYRDGLSGATKLCMGCHDGVTGLGALVNRPDIAMQDGYETLYERASAYSDLRNKHPVSFVYNDSVRSEIIATKGNNYGLPDDPTGNTIINSFVAKKWKQEGERVECTICHDPHEDRDGDASKNPFWVSTSIGIYTAHDSVCVSCHNPNFGEYTGFAEYTSL